MMMMMMMVMVMTMIYEDDNDDDDDDDDVDVGDDGDDWLVDWLVDWLLIMRMMLLMMMMMMLVMMMMMIIIIIIMVVVILLRMMMPWGRSQPVITMIIKSGYMVDPVNLGLVSAAVVATMLLLMGLQAQFSCAICILSAWPGSFCQSEGSFEDRGHRHEEIFRVYPTISFFQALLVQVPFTL